MAKQTISITVKLFGGIDLDSGFSEYDPAKGLDLATSEGIRLADGVLRDGRPWEGTFSHGKLIVSHVSLS